MTRTMRKMKRIGLLLLAMGLSTGVHGQVSRFRAHSAPAQVASESDFSRYFAPAEVFRAVADEGSGNFWLLLRDSARPGGPGQWVFSAQPKTDPGHEMNLAGRHSASIPVICAGQAILVEEHSEAVDARLEASALSAASKGNEFRARLKVGGKIVRVRAVGPGRAELERESEVAR